MKEILMLELLNCLNRREFKFIFALLMMFSVGAFLFTCSRYYGHDMSLIRSAYDVTMLNSPGTNVLLSVELILLPLFASIVYSDTFYSDVQSGVYKNVLTRVGVRHYIWAKAIVVVVVTFFSFILPFLVNQLLCVIAFPIKGYDNNFDFPPYDIGFQNFHPHIMYDLLRIESPLAYNLLYMVLISFTAALFALFTYGVFFALKKGKFATISGVFLSYMVMLLVTSQLSYRVPLNHLLQPGNDGSLAVLLLWMLVLLVLSLGMIVTKTIRIEVGIEK